MKDLSGYPGDTIRTSADPIVVPCDFDTVPDAAFIASLRPVSGELQEAHAGLQRGDVNAAREAVVKHFLTRQEPVYHFDNRDGNRRKYTLPSRYSCRITK